MQLVDYTDQLKTLLSLDPRAPRRCRHLPRHAARCASERACARSCARPSSVAPRETCDFVQDVVRPLPLAIVCDILGIPEADRERVGQWADLLAGSMDPEIASGGKTGTQGAIEFGTYAFQLQQQGAAGPADSLLAVLKNAELDGEQVDLMTFCGLFVQIAIAGNETTRSTLAGGVLELARQPALYDALARDPQRIPAAVEEMLRFLSPVHYFRRTATRDTELRGQKIRAGERVVMMYASRTRRTCSAT
jgi:cytochrome P450